jgi:DNA-binding NarL/FixJ family response regulator
MQTYLHKALPKILLADIDYGAFRLLKPLLSVKNGFYTDFLWCGERDQYRPAVLTGIYELVLMEYSVESLFVLEQAISEGCCTPVVMLADQSSDALMIRAARCGALGVLNRKEIELHSLKYFLLCARMHRHQFPGNSTGSEQAFVPRNTFTPSKQAAHYSFSKH